MISTTNYTQWHRVRLMLLALACAASVIVFQFTSAFAQGQTTCDTISATRAEPYVVKPGESAQPGNGKTYGPGAKVWGNTIKVCSTTSANDAGGEGPTMENAGAATVSGRSNSEGWEITWYKGATPQMHGEGAIPWAAFPALDPAGWPEFPNVSNPAKNFPAAWGLEYGMDEHQFCGAGGDQCELVVAAGGYALVTGYWSLEGLGECHAPEDEGCALYIVNVGEVSAQFVGTLDNVFVVTGRYWHGDHTPEATVAAMSHATWNMTNGASDLNPSGSVNAGANCSVRRGCRGVNDQFFVTSGNEKLVHGETNWSR